MVWNDETFNHREELLSLLKKLKISAITLLSKSENILKYAIYLIEKLNSS